MEEKLLNEEVNTNEDLEVETDYNEESETNSKLGLGILLGAGIAGIGTLAYKKLLKPGFGAVKDKIKSRKANKESKEDVEVQEEPKETE